MNLLPAELHTKVFSYLPGVDYFKCRGVCRYWKGVLDEMSGTLLFQKRLAEMVNLILCSPDCSLPSLFLETWGKRLISLETHNISGEVFPYLSRLECLTLHNDRDSKYLLAERRSLPELPNLKRLTIYGYPIYHKLSEVVPSKFFPNLTTLRIAVCGRVEDTGHFTTIWNRLDFLSLREFSQVRHFVILDQSYTSPYQWVIPMFFSANQLNSLTLPITSFRPRTKIRYVDETYIKTFIEFVPVLTHLKKMTFVSNFDPERYEGEEADTRDYIVNRIAKIFQQYHGLESWEIVSKNGELILSWGEASPSPLKGD